MIRYPVNITRIKNSPIGIIVSSNSPSSIDIDVYPGFTPKLMPSSEVFSPYLYPLSSTTLSILFHALNVEDSMTSRSVFTGLYPRSMIFDEKSFAYSLETLMKCAGHSGSKDQYPARVKVSVYLLSS